MLGGDEILEGTLYHGGEFELNPKDNEGGGTMEDTKEI